MDSQYHREAFTRHGATPQGVDWNSDQDQHMLFHLLARILPAEGSFSVLDFGCGYGAFLPFLQSRWQDTGYVGLDVVQQMIAIVSEHHVFDTYLALLYHSPTAHYGPETQQH